MDHLQYIFDSSLDAIGVSQRGVHRMVNPAYLKLFGYDSAEQLIGRPIAELIAPSERARVSAMAVARAEKQSVPLVYESRGLRRDGSEFDMEVYGSTYEVDGLTYSLVTLRDVTERNRAAAAMRESEERFRMLTEQALVGTAILQGNRIRFVNRKLAEMLEYTPEEMLEWETVDFARHFHPDDLAFVREQLAKKMRGEPAVTQYSFRQLTRSGRERWMELYSKPITHEGAPAVLISQIDITERRTAEAERAALEEALRQAQKMEAVGRLAGGVAHDFNNLLMGIVGNVDLALRRKPLPPAAAEDLEEIRRAAHRAAGLTAQLLAFSRKKPIAPKVLEPNQLVANLEGMLRRLVDEGVTLTTRLTADLPAVKADAAQLEQAIVNLVVNARDAITNHGTIEIFTETVEPGERERAALGLSRAGRYVRITVRDDGCGMSEEVQRHLFEPFFTTKPTGRGTGLGLAMVFGAVSQAGGTASAQTAVGKGSSFHLWLPAFEGPKEEAVPRTPEPPRWAGAKRCWWWRTRRRCAGCSRSSSRSWATGCWPARTARRRWRSPRAPSGSTCCSPT